MHRMRMRIIDRTEWKRKLFSFFFRISAHISAFFFFSHSLFFFLLRHIQSFFDGKSTSILFFISNLYNLFFFFLFSFLSFPCFSLKTK